MPLDFSKILLLVIAFIVQEASGAQPFSWTKVEDDDVSFRLYTRRNPDFYQELRVDDVDSVINSHINIYTSVKIIIHGWKNHGNSTLNRSLRYAYLTVSDVNVISVHWAQLAKKPYPIARLLVDNLGNIVARMIDFLVTLGISLKDIHVLGHSLGAHVAGIAGQKITSGNLSRITGLDPAGPLFYSNNDGRLDDSDADFVDVLHTSGLYLGYFAPLGHVDFYPNRGTPVQPGCGLDILGRCSHQRSYWLFSESILNKTPFVAISCISWNHYKHFDCETETLMGEYVDKTVRGNFYLKTTSESPFALGNSSFYALPPPAPVIDSYISASERIENVTLPLVGVDEDFNECECTSTKTAAVLGQLYRKVSWNKMREKIDSWMKNHDCTCLLHPHEKTQNV